MKKVLYILLLLPALLCSCVKDDFRPVFIQTEETCLMQRGSTVFSYDPLTCQMGFNREKNEFRVHTDNMSDFYIVTLDRIPVQLGEKVEGTIVWTTETSIYTRKKITLEAVRIEGERIWLWHEQSRTGVTVSALE